jgi:hypothetical protein
LLQEAAEGCLKRLRSGTRERKKKEKKSYKRTEDGLLAEMDVT